MNPAEADKRIRATPHTPGALNPLNYMKSAWKEISAVASSVGLIASALIALDVITPSIRGIAIIIITTVGAAIGVGVLVFRRISTEYQRVRPTIHLDRDSAYHTIDLHFKEFLPDGDISILQTWIPESRDEPKGSIRTDRIERWQEFLQDAIVGNRATAVESIRFKVLLLGSEEVLRNRIRYRWDLAHLYNFKYPLRGKELEEIVIGRKNQIENIHKALLHLEKNIKKYLEDKVTTDFSVSIRYYRVTPCGPIYIFGKHALLAGFYDHRWTSDRAPAIRLDNAKSAEWVHFQTQFDCIWSLKDPLAPLDVPPDNRTTIYTTHTPSWRGTKILID